MFVNQHSRHTLGYKKYKLFDVAKFILIVPTFWLIQQSLSRTRRWMKSLHSVLKLFIIVSNDNEVANIFNEYFSNLVEGLKPNVPENLVNNYCKGEDPMPSAILKY